MAALGKEERTILGDVLVQTRAYIGTLGRRLRGIVQPAIDRTAPLMVDIRADPGRYAVSFDLADREKGFEEPTLIIAGRQDTVVGYREAWTILESYPRATFAVIDRADHGWPLESHDLLGALIDD